MTVQHNTQVLYLVVVPFLIYTALISMFSGFSFFRQNRGWGVGGYVTHIKTLAAGAELPLPKACRPGPQCWGTLQCQRLPDREPTHVAQDRSAGVIYRDNAFSNIGPRLFKVSSGSPAPLSSKCRALGEEAVRTYLCGLDRTQFKHKWNSNSRPSGSRSLSCNQ